VDAIALMPADTVILCMLQSSDCLYRQLREKRLTVAIALRREVDNAVLEGFRQGNSLDSLTIHP
jgi:hypothetical protein